MIRKGFGKMTTLFFFSECKVAGITQTWYNVRLCRQLFIDSANPDVNRFRHVLLNVFYTLYTSKCSNYMRMPWFAAFE